jgi:hypothetical protein
MRPVVLELSTLYTEGLFDIVLLDANDTMDSLLAIASGFLRA